MNIGIVPSQETIEELNTLQPHINLLVPFQRSKLKFYQEALPQFQVRGHTLLSANPINTFYLKSPILEKLQGMTTLEVEQYLLQDILEFLEQHRGQITTYEALNEVINYGGQPRKTPWSRQFYRTLIKEIRQFDPSLCLYYSDYYYINAQKYLAIRSLLQDLQLDGVCIQLHLSLLSTQIYHYFLRDYLGQIVRQFKVKGYKVDITEVGIRIKYANIFRLTKKRNFRDRFSVIRDAAHEMLLNTIPLSQRRNLQKQLYTYLLDRCLDWKVDNFYCWGTDRNFARRKEPGDEPGDEPSFIDRQLHYKLNKIYLP
jgi:GH35 family endo-1,4-beta-xylanase